MGISPEVAKLVKDVEELTAKLKSAEDFAKTAETTIDELKNEVSELKLENGQLDTASQSYEAKMVELEEKNKAGLFVIADFEEKLKAQSDEILEVSGNLKLATAKIAELTKVADEAKASAEALEAAVTDVTETKEAVVDQLAVLASQLGPKGAIPEIVEGVSENASSAVHNTWIKLSNSPNPADKIAARKLYAANQAEIDGAVAKRSQGNAASVAEVQVATEDKVIFDAWTDIRLRAKNALGVFSPIPANDRPRVHAELTVEARKFYNKPENKAAIDRVLAGGDMSALSKTA